MPRKPSEQSMLQSQMQDCIRDCQASHTACLEAAMRVMQKGSRYADTARIMLDCSEICATAAHSMLRDSPLYGYICRACAESCTHCSELAAEIGENDCANACQTSATSCQQMLKMVAV